MLKLNVWKLLSGPSSGSDLNTSHVKVKHLSKIEIGYVTRFKYISC